MVGAFCQSPTPPAQLNEAYDCLEIYSGCGQMTKEWAKQGFHVFPPLELKKGFNLCEQGLFWGLLSLLRLGGVRFLRWAPPCTTFSLARTPKLRRLHKPWGLQLLDSHALTGNLHAGQSLALAWAQLEVGGAFGGEQPAWGFMRALGPWRLLVEFGAFEVIYD